MIKSYCKALIISLVMLLSLTTYANTTRGVMESDAALVTKVNAQIAGDPGLSIFNIHATAKKGIIYLRGTVNSEADADALIQLAQSTTGVTDVNTDQLRVKGSNKPLRDSAITAKVKGIYMREKLMGNEVAPIAVHVETNNGVVYLSGTVDNEAEKANAIKLAKSVKGVRKVQSRLEISAAHS